MVAEMMVDQSAALARVRLYTKGPPVPLPRGNDESHHIDARATISTEQTEFDVSKENIEAEDFRT